MPLHRICSVLIPTLALITTTGLRAADADDVVARVNGEPITQQMLEVYSEQKSKKMQGKTPERSAVLDELIGIELLVQDAEDKGLDETEAVTRQIDLYRRSLLVQIAVRDYLDNHPVPDEAVREKYEAVAQASGGMEYHARHILVDTEAEAEAIIGQLREDADFAELAREKSTGPTGSRGGDLGWFSADRMVPEFAEALQEMEPGSISSEPVKTQFGWHVIRLEETREASPPSLEEMREAIVSQLRNERLNAYLESLREAAEIETAEE